MMDLEPLPLVMRETKMVSRDSVNMQGQGQGRDRDRGAVTRLFPVLLRHWWQTLGLAILFGAVAGYYGMKKVTQYYKAEASVMVSPIMPRVMYMTEESRAAASSSYYDEYLHTLTRLFVERRVLDEAAKKLEADRVQWRIPGTPAGDPVEAMRNRLTIDLVRNTNLISISARDTRADSAAALVNEVVKAFLHQLSLEESLENDAKVRTLSQEQMVKQVELSDLYAQFDKLTEKLGSAALDARQNVYFDRAASLNEPLNRAYLERLRAEADDAAAQNNIEMLKRSIPTETIRKALDADPDVREMRLLIERQSRDTVVQTGSLGAEHPLKVRGEEQMKGLQRRLDKLTEVTNERIVMGLLRERQDDAERIAIDAKAKRDSAIKVEDSMRKSMDTALRDLADFGKAQVEVGKLKVRIDRLTEGIASVEKRIEQLKIEARAAGRVSLRSEAEVSAESASKTALIVVCGCAVAGLLAAVSLVFAMDLVFPALTKGGDLGKFGIMALSSGRIGAKKPESWIDMASRLVLIAGKNSGVQILAPDGLADARAQNLMQAMAQFGRRIVILDHDPKLGVELFRETTGNLTRLRLNLAASCGFSRSMRELASQEKNAFFCAVLPLGSDPLLVKDLFAETLIPVVLATSNRASARALASLAGISRQVRLYGAVVA